ncbi:BMP family lipoprotein [Halorhabdus rudnickae]|uniref:BMP family lipoprotein n=1 Tax=Halorhabdus rudnickae TaxID=1775544 RepID=UPI001082B502|nr:BMP family protein [Halorhabdus rudnickae]
MSQNYDRRSVIKGIAVGGIGVSLAGCSGNGSDTTEPSGNGDNGGSNDGSTENTDTGGSSGGDAHQVGMVYSTGGLGDNSFNDMAHRGIQTATEEYNLKFQNAEPESPSEFSTFQRQFATSSSPEYDQIFAIGFSQKSALQEVAPDFPDLKFTFVDATTDLDNVANYVFKEHEGSFQAGILAGMLTSQEFSAGPSQTDPDSNTIGFVGGKETRLIKKFEAGYRFGAKQVNENVKINVAYSGSWSEPSTGQSIANSMIDDGADVLYHAAGGTGVGVLQAAYERGAFGIGVDARQSETLTEYNGAILGSMVKQVDEAVITSVGNAINGEFRGGETTTLGLAEEGIALLYGTEIGDQIPQEIKDEIEAQSQTVIDGDVTVPSHPDDL